MARLLKRRDLIASTGMGGSQSAAVHELDRPTGTNTVYSAGSPIRHGQRKQPRLLPKKAADFKQKSLKDRLSPLLEAREQANKVYNATYFENHYPRADRDLKTKLHEKVMNAHSRLRAEDDGEHSDEGKSPVTIILNIGK